MKLVSKKLALAVQVALLIGAGAVAPTALASQAAATPQEQSDTTSTDTSNATQMQSVMVTGSRIRQVNLETQQPILTMTREDIQKLGLVTVGDILSHLSVQGPLTTNRQSVTGGGTNLGGSYFNMRGLGAERVLVLVNGKRWARNTNGAVDVSTIPSAIIQRIDVLKDGASAVYGSDAVTGVVNIITRKNFDGAEANAYYGQTGHGDNQTERYSFTFGSSNEKSSLMMNLSYTKQGVMWDDERERTRYPDGPRHPGLDWSLMAPRAKYYTLDAKGNPDDTFALNNLGDDTTDPGNYHPYTGALSDQYNPNIGKMFRLPTEQQSLYVQGEYHFTDHVSVQSTAMYSRRRAHVVSGSTEFGSTSFNGAPGTLSADSIYNPINQDVGFFRRYTGLPSSSKLTSKTSHLDTALKGWFGLGGRQFYWDVGVNYNKNDIDSLSTGVFNLDHAAKALGPSFIDASGVATCGTPTDVVGGGCVPWNVLGGPAGLTPEMRQYLLVTNKVRAGSKEVDYTANINGGLFDIPFGGETAFALGVERREVSGFRYPDSLASQGLTTAGGGQPEDGAYSVNSAYYELSIPLLRNMPGAQDLSFDIAGRYSKYSNFGSTFNGKYSFEWKPINDLLIRGTYSESFHAPTIDRLYGGVQKFTIGLLDPCDSKYGPQLYGQKVRQACVAELKSLGFSNAEHFRQVDATGQPINSTNPLMVADASFGSNPDLGPETAISRTLGMVYSPSYIPGLGLTLDWYRIELSNAVGIISPPQTVTQCYLGNQQFCRFHRDQNGAIVDFHYGVANFGRQTVEGYDFELNYKLPETDFGRFTIRSANSYLVKNNQDFSLNGVGSLHFAAGANQWRLRSNTSLDWTYGHFGATWTIRYFSSLREKCKFMSECNMPDFVSPENGAVPQRRIGAIAFHDVSVRWDAPWNARISLGINNVFDRDPPLVYARLDNSGSGPWLPAYDMDRYFFVSYDQKF